MNGSFRDSDRNDKVNIPVKMVAGHLEFFYGGKISIKEGAIGDLVLSASQLLDQNFIKRLRQQAVVKILNQGAELKVALSDKSGYFMTSEQKSLIDNSNFPAGATRFVSIYLGPAKGSLSNLADDSEKGGLWLRVRGFDKAELVSSVIGMPEDVNTDPAISLNHAFTMLSEKYETHRISHTGNVYTRVFYQEENGRWYPLSDLREGVLAEAERSLLAESWRSLEEMLGWRPAIKPSKKKIR